MVWNILRHCRELGLDRSVTLNDIICISGTQFPHLAPQGPAKLEQHGDESNDLISSGQARPRAFMEPACEPW